MRRKRIEVWMDKLKQYLSKRKKILLSRPERITTGNDLQIIYRIIPDYIYIEELDYLIRIS